MQALLEEARSGFVAQVVPPEVLDAQCLKFAGRRDVTALHAIERAMAVPMKRFERPLLAT